MNEFELANAARDLETSFNVTENLTPKVSGLYRDLKPYIEQAKRKEIKIPMDKFSLPGGYLFNEGELTPYPEIERAYVNFRMQISGGLSEKAKRVLKRIEKI